MTSPYSQDSASSFGPVRPIPDAQGGARPEGKSPEELQQDIRQTRERMSKDIDAIGDKLTPSKIKAQVKEQVMAQAQHTIHEARDKVRDFADSAGVQAKQAGSTVVETIKNHPVPAAIIGAGLGWFFALSARGDRSSGSGGYRSTENMHADVEWRGSPYSEGPYGAKRPGNAHEHQQYGSVGRGETGKSASDAYERARRSGAQSSVVETIKNHPVPAAVIGAGLGWLLLQNTQGRRTARSRFGYQRPDDSYGDADWRGRPYSEGPYTEDPYSESAYSANPSSRGTYGEAGASEGSFRTRSESAGEASGVRSAVSGASEKASEVAGEATERARELAGQASERAREFAGQASNRAREFAGEARERAGRLRTETRQQARQASDRAQSLFEENPLILGAAALVVGLAFGGLIPGSRRENEWMGETRDKLLDRAREKVQTAKDAAVTTAREVKDTAIEEAQRYRDDVKLDAQDAVQRAKSAAQHVVEEAKETVKREAKKTTGQSTTGRTTGGTTGGTTDQTSTDPQVPEGRKGSPYFD